MKYRKGDIVIISFPFSDLSHTKKRPALIISNDIVNKTGDYLMVQVTSKIREDKLSLTLRETDYMDRKVLPLPSCIRLHKVFLLHESLIISANTTVSPTFLDMAIEKIVKLIK